MAKRKTRTISRLEADLRFAPDEIALRSVMGEARRTARLRSRQADAAARGLRQAVRERARAVEKAYDYTDAVGSQAAAAAAAALEGVSQAADPYRAILAGELAAGRQRAAEARAAARGEIGKIRTSIARERSSRLEQIGRDLQEAVRQVAAEQGNIAAERAKLEGQMSLQRLKGRQDVRAERLKGRQTLQLQRLKGRQTKTKGGKKTNRFTALQRRDARESLAGAITDARTGVRSALKKNYRLTVGQVAGQLRANGGYKPTIALAAAQLAVRGEINPKTRRRLKSRFGISAPSARRGVGRAISRVGGVKGVGF